jgi:Domain of unknown function (DUF5664)
MEFTKALEIIAQTMQAGAATHLENNWTECPASHHIHRAHKHLQAWFEGDQTEDHVSHACCRLLMALTLREKQQ